MKDEIRRAVYEKYIVPTKAERPDYIGVEIEMPVVNLTGEPVDEQIAIQTAESLAASTLTNTISSRMIILRSGKHQSEMRKASVRSRNALATPANSFVGLYQL